MMFGQQYANEILARLEKESNPRVLVYVDPDIDGVVAARLIMAFLDERGIPYQWYCNTNRAHGFFLKEDDLHAYLGKDLRGAYILHGDFTTTESQIEWLVGLGINILSTDHHELPEGQKLIVKKDDEGVVRGVVINNQYEFENPARRYQSGAGVILTVLRDYAGENWGGLAAEQLVGWTLLSDVRDISGSEAKWWLSKLFSWNYNEPVSLKPGSLDGVLRHVVDAVMANRRDWEFGVIKTNRTFVDFTLSPAINALFRFDREKDAVKVFLGGAYPTYRGINGRNWQEYQRKVRDAILAEADVTKYGEHFAVLDLKWPYKNAILTECEASNFIGLAASQLMDQDKCCVIAIARDVGGEVRRASFRGVYNLPYRETLVEKDLLNGAGHSAAFGIPNMPKEVDMLGISQVVNNLVDNFLRSGKSDKKVMPVENLAIFDKNYGAKIAEINDYAPEADKIYLKYVGQGIEIKKSSPRRVLFSIDGKDVLYFGADGDETTVSSGIINISRGRVGVDYTLRKGD